MDIATLVQYDAPYEYELKNPTTEDGIGVVFKVISINSPGPKAVMRRNQAKVMLSGVGKEKLTDKKEGELVTMIEKNEGRTVDLLASCVVGWDWGKAEWNKKKNLEFTPENVKEVLAVDWIFNQLDGVVSDIENFTKA